MMDFTKMDYGVIMSGKGAIIVIKGAFFGPLNRQELGKLIDLWEKEFPPVEV